MRRGDFTDVSVPPTLQAAIASRIDRLTAEAKHLVNAAAVIGAQFSPDLVANVLEREEDSIQPGLSELVHAELIYPIVMTSFTEYAFRHPMIRTVAQESQLKSGRSALHRRLADAIRHRQPQGCRRECFAHRLSSRVGGRSARGIRLVHARRIVAREPRHRSRPCQLASCSP